MLKHVPPWVHETNLYFIRLFYIDQIKNAGSLEEKTLYVVSYGLRLTLCVCLDTDISIIIFKRLICFLLMSVDTLSLSTDVTEKIIKNKNKKEKRRKETQQNNSILRN